MQRLCCWRGNLQYRHVLDVSRRHLRNAPCAFAGDMLMALLTFVSSSDAILQATEHLQTQDLTTTRQHYTAVSV
jgi:hypothetical protein